MMTETLVYTVIPLLGSIVGIVLTLLAMLAPVVCVLKGYSFIKTNLIALPAIFAVLILGAYLNDVYPIILLKVMGFDLYGMSEAERTLNVDPALRDTATEIYGSIFGIGWPLEAIMTMIFVSPYPSAVWAAWALVKSGIKKAWHQ